DGRAGDAVLQLLARHAGALLARIEDERDAERAALLRVLHHRAGIIRRDDGEAAVARAAERELPRVRHRAGVERGDLVVRDVGAAEERRAELAVDLLRQRRVDARGLEPRAVLA